MSKSFVISPLGSVMLVSTIFKPSPKLFLSGINCLLLCLLFKLLIIVICSSIKFSLLSFSVIKAVILISRLELSTLPPKSFLEIVIISPIL